MRDREKLERRIQYSRAIFDAIPVPTLIVDEDVRICDFNTAAEALLGSSPASGLHQRGGEVLGCLHAEASGCGKGEQCKDCVVRNGVRKALAGGAVYRERHLATLRRTGRHLNLDLLVTATLLPYTEFPQALLVLENLTELFQQHTPRKRRLALSK